MSNETFLSLEDIISTLRLEVFKTRICNKSTEEQKEIKIAELRERIKEKENLQMRLWVKYTGKQDRKQTLSTI